MKNFHSLLLCISLLGGWPPLLAQQSSPIDERDYVGNVVGSVVEAANGRSISDVTVFLLNKPWQLLMALPAGAGNSRSRLLALSIRRGLTNSNGLFLINRVPTPYPYKVYTVVARAQGYDLQVLDQIPVLPGAVMSLECHFALTRGMGMTTVFHKDNREAPYHYSHEGKLPIPPILQQEFPWQDGQPIFATREGLVGRTTANGHVIRERDRFVALPSRRALSSNGGNEFQVKLTYRGKSVVAPVWDVGPWNARDDHWNPPPRRERWRDLTQGLPQAQAAFQDGYNRGKDEFGRQVLNPVGIDLADGIFWNDLQMRNNDWIKVEYLWATTEVSSRPTTPQPSPGSKKPPNRKPSRGIGSTLAEILAAARGVLAGSR